MLCGKLRLLGLSLAFAVHTVQEVDAVTEEYVRKRAFLMNGDVFEKCTIIQKYKLCVLDKIADILSDLYLF